MRVRRTVSAVSVAGMTMLGLAVGMPAAHASGYGCAGNLVWTGSVPLVSGGTAGTIYDYYNGTYNCSVFVKSDYYGTPTYMDFAIANDGGTIGNEDQGVYSYYAGPSTVYGVGHCVHESIMEEAPNFGPTIVNYTTPWHSC